MVHWCCRVAAEARFWGWTECGTASPRLKSILSVLGTDGLETDRGRGWRGPNNFLVRASLPDVEGTQQAGLAGGDVDAFVVGSGFGGAVAAARLAQAGLRVVMAERGRRWQRGSFPRNTEDVTDRWLWAKGRGLYDVRWLDRMISVQGAGWGGGSLVYANVFTRPPAEVFQSWPAAYSRQALDPFYDLHAHMLQVRPIAANPSTGRFPARTLAMEALVADLSRASGTVRPHLAVQFADPGQPVTNRHGEQQFGCTFVGECMLGCNVGAKNSLDYNYLAVAERAGAQALTETEVVGIATAAGGYQVTVLDHTRGEAFTVEARAVFLAGGAVGSTELLLRCRDVARTLPDLSPTLGENFSGNGDYLAFVKSTKVPLDPDDGPTITTSSVVDVDLKGEQVWFQVQDGGYPRLLDNLSAGLDPTHAQRQKVKVMVAKLLARVRIELTSAERKKTNRMTMLLMGRDTSDGRLTLDDKGEARVAWRNRPNRGLYQGEEQVARLVGRALGGRMRPAATWTFLRQAVTVHNLGGVPMGGTRATGVVDDNAEVHGYPHLYVVDGSVLPTATGVNPSATIAAMAERNVERAVRRLTGNQEWQAPETPDVNPLDAPEDVAMAEMSRERRLRSGDGVRFSEQLSGTLHTATGPPMALVLRLDVELPGWRNFLADPSHALQVTGTAAIGAGEDTASVGGELQLFPEDDSVAMRYLLTLTGPDEQTRRLVGVKTQRPGRPLAVWADLTELTVQLTADGTSSPWNGMVKIATPDVLRLAASIRGDAFTTRRRLRSQLRFYQFFARHAYAGMTNIRRVKPDS